MRYLALLAVAALLAGCGGSSYAANVKTNFLNACEQSSSVSGCECALSHVEDSVSVGTLQAAERDIAAGSTNYPTWMTDAISACAGK